MASEAKVTAVIEAKDQATKVLNDIAGGFSVFNSRILGVVGAIGIVGGSMVKVANDTAEFNKWIARAGSNVDATSDQLKEFGDIAVKATKDTSFNASQAAAALYQLAGGSISADEAMVGLQQAVQFATANGLENLDDAAIAVANVMTLFKLKGDDAARAMDVLTAAGHAAFGTTEEIVSAFKEAAPSASQLGISIEELSGIFSAMAESGFRGTEAGVAVKRALQELIAPTESVQERFDELGIVMTDAGTSIEKFTSKADEKLIKKYTDEIERANRSLSSLEITLSKQNNRLHEANNKGKTASASYRNLQIDIQNTKDKIAEQNETVRLSTELLAGIEPVTRTVRNAGGNFIGLSAALDELEEKTKNMSSIERVAFLSETFGQIAGPAMSALISQGSEARAEYIRQMGEAGGATAKAADQINAAVNPVEKLQQRFFELERKVLPGVTLVLEGLVGFIDKVLSPALGFLWRVEVEGLSNAFLAVMNAGNFLTGTVFPAIVSAVNAVRDAFNNAIGAVSTFIQKSKEAVSGAASGLGGGIVSGLTGFGHMLGFASGGIVPGPLGSPQFAVVHGGERVITPSGLSAAGGGVVVNITGNTIANDVDMRQLADQVGREVMRALRRAQNV